MNEVARGNESVSVRALVSPPAEAGTWRCLTRVDKWERGADYEAGLAPDSFVEEEGNILVNAGINLLESLLIGGAGTAFTTAANAYLGVGTNVAAAVATQTALQTQLDRKVATAVVTNQTVTFQATFNSDASLGAWEEAGVFNAAAAGTMLNRRVAALGTKGAGATWVLTMTVTIS